MLKSFRSKNFRCLEDFEIDNLSRVNLLIGDNDTGKTALLEALFWHMAQAKIKKFVTVKAFRRSLASVDETFWQEFFTDFDDSREIQFWSVDASGPCEGGLHQPFRNRSFQQRPCRVNAQPEQCAQEKDRRIGNDNQLPGSQMLNHITGEHRGEQGAHTAPGIHAARDGARQLVPDVNANGPAGTHRDVTKEGG